MTLISDAIAQAQALITTYGLLLDTCTVKAPTAGAADGFGGEADTLTTVATGVKCAFEWTRELALAVYGGAVTGTIRTEIYLELSDVDLQSIGTGWQVIINARGNKPALTFEDPRRLDESNEILLAVSAKLKQ
jgi:hypothetical protein